MTQIPSAIAVDPSYPVPAHGGVLVNRELSGPALDDARREADSAPPIVLRDFEVSDVEMIASGALSPLEGFQGEADFRSVLERALLDDYYPAERTLLAVFPAAMRYAGPREAVFHAIARKNYGVTHFIVGRDHAGVNRPDGSAYYGTYEAQEYISRFPREELGIEIFRFENTFYDRRTGGMVSEKTKPARAEPIVVSGTRLRDMLRAGELPPEAVTRPEVARILIEEFRNRSGNGNGAGGGNGTKPANPVSAAAASSPAERPGFTLWFTGLSGAGKSTLARALTKILKARGRRVEVLDGDEVRENLSKGLGFSREDRDINIRRIGYVCHLLSRNGVVAISAAISPFREVRDEVRRKIGSFVEVFVKCPLDVLVKRDVKGLYKKALAGEIKDFTGVSHPYEEPLYPEVVVETDRETIEESAARIVRCLEEGGLL